MRSVLLEYGEILQYTLRQKETKLDKNPAMRTV